jgi:hypothetical protein
MADRGSGRVLRYMLDHIGEHIDADTIYQVSGWDRSVTIGSLMRSITYKLNYDSTSYKIEEKGKQYSLKKCKVIKLLLCSFLLKIEP